MATRLGILLNVGLNIKDGLHVALDEFISANAHLKKFSKDKVRINITDTDCIVLAWQREKNSSIIDDIAIFEYVENSNQFIGSLTEKYVYTSINIITTITALNENLIDSINFLKMINGSGKTSSKKVPIGFHLSNEDNKDE